MLNKYPEKLIGRSPRGINTNSPILKSPSCKWALEYTPKAVTTVNKNKGKKNKAIEDIPSTEISLILNNINNTNRARDNAP